MKLSRKPMIWILSATFLLTLLVNLPLLVGLSVFGRQLLSELWGYSPNQFAFLLFVFPAACLSILYGIWTLTGPMRGKLPEDSTVTLLRHPPVIFLLALIIAGVIAIGAYFKAELGLDTLDRPYALAALTTIDSIDRGLLASTASDAEAQAARTKSIRAVSAVIEAKRAQILNMSPSQGLSELERLRDGSPYLYLRLVEDSDIRFRLNLWSKPLQSANVIELVADVSIAIVGVIAVILYALVATRHGFDGAWGAPLRSAGTALFIGTLLFSFYGMAVGQASAELSQYVDRVSSIAEPMFASGLCLCLMLILLFVGPNGAASLGSIAGLTRAGIAILPTSLAYYATKPHPALQLLLGTETNVAIQGILGIISVFLFASLAVFFGQSLE